MTMQEVADTLKKAGISPTPGRILVYKSLCSASSPMSLSDLELELESVDKSTISRTLSLFREKHIVHGFNDGSGAFKYEICRRGDEELHDDTHVHFHCKKCGETFCLKTIGIPEVELPEDFIVHDYNYIITGICKECHK